MSGPGGVPARVVAAAAREGWQGLTAVAAPLAGGAPLLVCVACRGDLRRLRAAGLSLLAHAPGCSAARRFLALAVGPDDEVRMPLDLAGADERALVLRLAACPRVTMCWLESESARLVATDRLTLTEEARGLMRDAVCRAAEWHGAA